MAKICKCGHRKKDHYDSRTHCRITIDYSYLIPERRVNSMPAACMCEKFEDE